jgi:hypothetical protein
MRKSTSRLTLSKETIHLLEGRELSKAAGLTIANSCAACSATLACTVCSHCAGATCGNTC